MSRRSANEVTPDPPISEMERRNYAGWEGLFFHCRISGPDDSRLAQICAQAARDVQKLASKARVNLEVFSDEANAAVAAAVSPYVMLRVDLTATEGGPPVAIYAHVRAYSFYMGAVDVRALPLGERPNPRKSERSGEVVFWERRLVGVCEGTPEALQAKFSQALATNLGDFLERFAAAQVELVEPAPARGPTF